MGKLHVQFSKFLDFSDYAKVSPKYTPYLASIDKDKFYEMLNLLLKWAWPWRGVL